MSIIIDAILQRYSIPAHLLAEPAPNQAEITTLIQAATRAPDHAGLRPWRFLVITPAGREQLATAMTAAAKQQNAAITETELKTIREKSLRAPLILVAIVKLQANPKVPEPEQWLSAGAAVQNILLTANAMGYGGIWLTGPFANHAVVTKTLGLTEAEQIAGFIHLGTPVDAAKAMAKKVQNRPQVMDFSQNWPLS